MCGVVGGAEAAAVGQGDLGELAGRVVGVAGVFAAGGLAGQAAPGVVAEGGGQTVRVDDGQRPAVRVVGDDFSEVAEGVGDRGEVAALAEVGVVGGIQIPRLLSGVPYCLIVVRPRFCRPPYRE
jgi:hypothetical protein